MNKVFFPQLQKNIGVNFTVFHLESFKKFLIFIYIYLFVKSHFCCNSKLPLFDVVFRVGVLLCLQFL